MQKTNFTVDFKKSIVCFAKFKLENRTVGADYLKEKPPDFNRSDFYPSSETQGQLVGVGKSLNGREKKFGH